MKKSECVEALRKRGYDCEEEGSVVIVYGETDEKAIRRVLSEIGYKASFGISSRTRKIEKDEERAELSEDDEVMPEIGDDEPAVEDSAEAAGDETAFDETPGNEADRAGDAEIKDETVEEQAEKNHEEAEASIEEVEEQMDIFRVNDAHQTSIFDFL